MGEMADWLYDNYVLGELEQVDEYPIQCKYCGKDDLVWVNEGSDEKPKWRLYEYEENIPHTCQEYINQ